jgi:LysM repeat protein
MAYCIRAPGYANPSPSSGPTTTAVGPPGPTHTGQPASCNKWHVVVNGDSCSSVAAKYSITTAQFFSWNPAVSTDCVTNFWLGQAYCVGVSGATPTNPTSPPTTTTANPSAPSPTQAGNAVASCNKYAQAQDGDSCSAFADRNAVTLQQLYTWNTLLKSDGSGCASSFWATYWYCVGVKAVSRVQPVTSN